MRNKIFGAVLMLAVPGVSMGEYAVTISPGELEGALKEMPQGKKELKLSGSAGITDLLVLHDLEGIESLDLTGLKIEGSRLDKGNFYGRTLFYEDELPSYIFSGTGYKRIVMPSGITAIGEGTFSGSSLESVEIPATVRTIGSYAFSSMKSLTTVSGGENVESIGTGVFSNDNLVTDIDLSRMRITSIPERAFSGCVLLTDVMMPQTVKKVGKYAFAGSGVTSLNVSGVTEIDDYAFSSMPELETATLSSSVQQGEGMFLGDARLSDAVGVSADVPAFTFSGCPSIDVNAILVYAENIGESAFAGNNALKLVFGKDVKSLGKNVFGGMNGLDTIEVKDLGANAPAVTAETFAGMEQKSIVLRVNDDDLSVWRNSPYWNEFDVQKYGTGSMSGVKSDGGIVITYGDARLVVTSADEIERIDIYGLEGAVYANLAPRETSATVDMTRYDNSHGVVVRVVTSRSERSVKILF